MFSRKISRVCRCKYTCRVPGYRQLLNTHRYIDVVRTVFPHSANTSRVSDKSRGLSILRTDLRALSVSFIYLCFFTRKYRRPAVDALDVALILMLTVDMMPSYRASRTEDGRTGRRRFRFHSRRQSIVIAIRPSGVITGQSPLTFVGKRII